jgi:hypothetical protein
VPGQRLGFLEAEIYFINRNSISNKEGLEQGKGKVIRFTVLSRLLNIFWSFIIEAAAAIHARQFIEDDHNEWNETALKLRR